MLATVGVPPTTATAPPFTRILPAASRLITIELSALSPTTVSTPVLNVAVVAALAGTARGGEHTGGEHGAGEQPAHPASPGVVTSWFRHVSSSESSRPPIGRRLLALLLVSGGEA